MTFYRDPPSIEDMMIVADRALEAIPAELSRLVRNVSIHIVDFPDDETLREMEMESPFDLLGLYSGVPFGAADGVTAREDIDRIFLYRRPILDYWCETGEDLEHVVRHVLIHEIGHHFGLSDDDMEALEQQADEAAES